MRRRLIITVLILLAINAVSPVAGEPVWPSPPDQARIAYCAEIRCDDLRIKSGFFGGIKQLLGGRSDTEKLALPFDVLVIGRRLYMTCQNLPALAVVDLDERSYQLFDSDEAPFRYPIALAGDERGIFVTDSDAGIVYKYSKGDVSPFITEGLIRPTGIAVLSNRRLVFVVDTGDHTMKVFDYDGNLLQTIGRRSESDEGFNYPTFAADDDRDGVILNDAMNFRIKRFSSAGDLIGAFGREGDGPGTFARPKGIAVDSQNHVYVVDNLFDNVQVFDSTGSILLVIGGRGSEPGEFWSPGGIDIMNDTIYIADTYNNRIQILRYLRDGK